MDMKLKSKFKLNQTASGTIAKKRTKVQTSSLFLYFLKKKTFILVANNAEIHMRICCFHKFHIDSYCTTYVI